MSTTIAVIVVLVVVALILAVLIAHSRGDNEPVWPYYPKKPLTKPEQVLFHRLVKALPDHIVLAQVQASRVLGVKKGFNFAAWNNRVNRLSIDFLVCLKDATVVAAIELDDASHENVRRQEADRRKDRALAAAGIPMLRWSVTNLPNESAIQAVVQTKPFSAVN